MAFARFCTHGNLRMTCQECKQDAVKEASERVALNRRRGESGTVGRIEGFDLPYPWQREGFEAWKDAGRSGLLALSLGLPYGDLPYAAMAEVVNESSTANVLIACAPNDRDGITAALEDRFRLHPSSLADHHFLEPKEDGTLLVADLEELQTVDLATWGRFASTGVLVLMDADGVSQHLGETLLQTPFRYRMALSRKPTAVDLVIGRPWSRAFGPLVYRFKEDQAREIGVLPRIQYRLHVEMLRPDGREVRGPTGPWEPNDFPTRLPGFTPGSFVVGRARDVAIRTCEAEPNWAVITNGTPVKGARATLGPRDIPEKMETPPAGWLMAMPTADSRTLMRVAAAAWKTANGPARLEDVVVLPVPVDLARVPPWEDKWRAAAGQIDRAVTGLLLAEDASKSIMPEDLEALVGVALALRGLPAEVLYKLTPVVTRAAEAAIHGEDIPVEEVEAAARSSGGLAAALLVAASSGPVPLLRLAHTRFTPVTPDLPHPSLCDARHHQWRGRAFQALAAAASKGDIVATWGMYPELRYVLPSSGLVEVATKYCADHKVKGPLHNAKIGQVPDVTSIAKGNKKESLEVLKIWRDALAKAEEHEREFLADMHERQPERERRRQGTSLPSLAVNDVRGDTVGFDSTQGRFPNTNISPGSEVAIVEQGERKEIARGLVSRISSRRVVVEFPAGAPRRWPKRITVNLTFDAKVFEAYHSAILGAVRAMEASHPEEDGPDGLLRALMLGEEGETTPSTDIPAGDLTPSQQGAVSAVLGGGRVRLIHGPPGTGKTHTLVHLANALARAGHSVLVTADSNAAVDNMVVGLRRRGALVVRVGHAPNLRDEEAESARIDPLEAPPFVRWAAGQGIVVATTNYGAYRYLDAKGSQNPFIFDYVIHDEAGQATAPSSLAAVMRGRRLVLAGDPLQLPPTVVSMDAKDAGLDVTLFERVQELTGRNRTEMLATQFRMRDEILQFSNKRYYEGRIETAPSAAEQEVLESLPSVAFQHVTGRENARQRNGSISNDDEVGAVAHLVEKFRGEARDKGWTIAVLTPYQAQREQLRRALPDVEISTVDAAQGREWDVVFYSSVRSNPKHRLGFLSDERRLNVAVTRARRHFFLIGDERSLRDHEGFTLLLEGAEKVRMYYPDKDRPKQLDQGHRGRGRGRGRGRRHDKPRDDSRDRHKDKAGDSESSGDTDGGKRKRRRRGRRRGGRDRPDAAETEAGSEDNSPTESSAAKRPRRSKAKGDADEKTAHAGGAKGRAKKSEAKQAPAKQAPAKQAPAKSTSGDGKKPCTATTKAGSPCKLKAKPGTKFCGRHS